VDQESDVREPLVQADGEMASLLYHRLAGGMGGDAAEMHPASAVLDEHQDIQPFQQHGIHVQEAGRDHPGGLGGKELPPGRARAARCRIDARGTEDFPDGGWRNRHAELGQLAVDPPVSPQRVLLRQADGEAGDAAACRRAAGLAALLVSYFPAASLRYQASSVTGVTGEHLGPAPARDELRQRGESCPVGWLVPHPAGMPAQHHVLMPEHQQLSILRPVARNTRTARPSTRQVNT
jgi:hypothetical protein